jgi:chemotaxis protein histidine kinase CheA
MENKIESLKPKSLGSVGEKIIELSETAKKEILSRWDETTMETIKRNGALLVAEAENFQIVDQLTFNAATELFVKIAQYKKQGGAFIEPMVEAMHQPHAMTCDIRREFYDPADAAKKIYDQKIGAWKAQERKRAEAEQNRLNAEAKAKEEAERQKLNEKARIEREKAEQERKEAEQKAAVERESAEKARREKEAAEEKVRKAEADKKAAELAAANAKNEEERKKAQAEADRQAAEKAKAQAEATERERAAFDAEQRAKKEISKGEIAAQEREQKAEAHEINAESVFIAPVISVPTVNKTEITARGKAVGIKEFKVTIVSIEDIIKAVVAGPMQGGFPVSVLNLDPERVENAFKRWAKMSMTSQRYAANGVIIEATERQSARPNSKATEDPK